jgi:tetratricopeptide (TPR) repeat protein
MNWQPGFRRPDQLCRLFMLHAQFGPLKGYADDIAMAGAWLNAPLGLYCQSLMAQRLMMPQKAEDLRQKAVRAAGNSAQTAYETGTDLADCGLSDLALPLLNTFLSMPTNIPGIVDSTDEARLRLALIYASKGDYQHAADMRNAIQKSLVQRGLRQLDIVDLDWGYVDYGIGQSTLDLDWRESRLKAAEEQHDAAGISSELDALLGLNSEFMDMDIVPLLVERGRQAEASAVFDRAYGKARALVDADPDTPKYLNDLARLCIRCDQRPAEADEMARKAVAAAPTEPEYIDTLATCELNIGRPREAVRLETIAVSLDRDNFAYIRQLDRFRAAAAAQAAR